jgi:hypothetical protein
MKLEASVPQFQSRFHRELGLGFGFGFGFGPGLRVKAGRKPGSTYLTQAQHRVDLLGPTNKPINKLTNQSSN